MHPTLCYTLGVWCGDTVGERPSGATLESVPESLASLGMVPGSWAELVVGFGSILVAAVLGWLALRQGKQAAKWAEKSTDLQRLANSLAEAALPVRFKVTMGHVVYHEGDETGQPFEAWLELESEEGSASVVIHRLETEGAFFEGISSIKHHFGDLFGKRKIEPDNEMPERLHVGGRMAFRNPWSSYSPELTSHSWARVRIYFSATSESPIRNVAVDVSLDEVCPRGDPA